ncbi:MAG: alpha/beta hydrolase [Methanomicrobiales archaeon]|nr:alpha/beta hydrolase [Methanomicrobiales archaeon]
MRRVIGDRLLLIAGERSFLLIGRAGESFPLFIETNTQEYCQGVEEDDLIVVSSPEGGKIEPAILLLELVRRYRIPLIVLPKNHPAIRRLRLVVSVAPEIRGQCGIQRGTHPEQGVICTSDEFGSIVLRGEDGAVVIENLPAHAESMIMEAPSIHQH